MDAWKPNGNAKGARVCPQCGAAFVCRIAADDATTGGAHCWCFDLPAVLPVRSDTACLCPVCLTNMIRQAGEVQ